MKITVLDADTLGKDVSLGILNEVGDVTVYNFTSPEEVKERIADCDVVIINKIKLNSENLPFAKNLKLICIAATGYDNIDVEYCKSHSIGVSNVVGYSTNSVALMTVTMALSLVTHLREYNDFVISGEYTRGGLPNRLEPYFHELDGMTWGVVGLGNIGKRVAKIAEALGCRVIASKRHPDDEYTICDIDTLLKESDIVSIHTPLNEQTRNLISKDRIALMKKNAILVNVARGAVVDEEELANAILECKIGGIGVDVYSKEPFGESHPFNKIKSFPNVCLTPHNAWGAHEARVRCLDEIAQNIKAFSCGQKRNRVDL